MSWPSTPLTTYVANSTPAIKAADLGFFQSGINGIVNGTFNLQGVVLTTGTPGSLVTPVNGSVLTARSLFSTTVPTPNTSQAGEHFRETAPAALGYFVLGGSAVTVRTAYGIHAKSWLSAGTCDITLQRIPTGPTAFNVVAVATGIGDTIVTIDISLDGSNRPVLNIKTSVLSTGSPASITRTDSSFRMAAWVF